MDKEIKQPKTFMIKPSLRDRAIEYAHSIGLKGNFSRLIEDLLEKELGRS